MQVIYETYKNIASFFAYPLDSSSLGILEISQPSGFLSVCDLQDIELKYVRFRYKDSFVVIPMLDK